jgi:5-methylcytosine-specific restriction enzyme A
LFVVYLLSADGKLLYLSLNQGCTALWDAVGIAEARKELSRRSELMRARVAAEARRFIHAEIDLRADLPRATLHSAGNVLSVEYDTANFPTDTVLAADLQEGLRLYRLLRTEGGWSAADDMVLQARADGVTTDRATIEEAKRYRLHQSIERDARHARLVKKCLGTRCMGCERDMAELYGVVATGLIEAHHLTPLSSLGTIEVSLDPRKDFAVLCPNCHAVIHRMSDVGDLDSLRALVSHARRP